MRIQVAKWGNSTAIRLPKVVVDELGLKAGQQVDIRIDSGEMRLKPAMSTIARYDVDKLLADFTRKGGTPPTEIVSWPNVDAPWPEDDPGT